MHSTLYKTIKKKKIEFSNNEHSDDQAARTKSCLSRTDEELPSSINNDTKDNSPSYIFHTATTSRDITTNDIIKIDQEDDATSARSTCETLKDIEDASINQCLERLQFRTIANAKHSISQATKQVTGEDDLKSSQSDVYNTLNECSSSLTILSSLLRANALRKSTQKDPPS